MGTGHWCGSRTFQRRGVSLCARVTTRIQIRVPSAWERVGWEGLDGVAWYRVSFTLSEREAAAPIRLSLGPIDDHDITWINGVEVGRTAGYAVPRNYIVPTAVAYAGRNVIAIRVEDGAGDGGPTRSPSDVYLDIGGVRTSLAGTWRFAVGEVSIKPDGQRINKVPTFLYNQMLHPLLNTPIAGVIWYQGESNANNDAQALAYRAQDVGNPRDIHPLNKEEVAHRLALLARVSSLRQSVTAAGPVSHACGANGQGHRHV